MGLFLTNIYYRPVTQSQTKLNDEIGYRLNNILLIGDVVAYAIALWLYRHPITAPSPPQRSSASSPLGCFLVVSSTINGLTTLAASKNAAITAAC